MLGDVELVIKVSKAPLEQDLRGISIFSNGVWHETTFAGSENKEMAHYIFGEIEVPKLDDDKSPIAPFDVSRSMRLNPENETARVYTPSSAKMSKWCGVLWPKRTGKASFRRRNEATHTASR